MAGISLQISDAAIEAIARAFAETREAASTRRYEAAKEERYREERLLERQRIDDERRAAQQGSLLDVLLREHTEDRDLARSAAIQMLNIGMEYAKAALNKGKANEALEEDPEDSAGYPPDPEEDGGYPPDPEAFRDFASWHDAPQGSSFHETAEPSDDATAGPLPPEEP